MVESAFEAESSARETRFSRLYQAHFRGAVRLAYLLTGDRPLSEDIAQDAFLRLALRLAHLRDPDAFGPYLRRTVINLANAHFRHKRVERRYLEQEANQPEHLWTGPDVPERDAIWVVLLALPPRQRAAVVLRFYEDLSEGQIAHIMRCRPGTVKSLLSKGIAKIRAVMTDE